MSKVMIVEDDQTSVKLLRILLEEVDGFEVSVARKGGDVMLLAEKTLPDVFLIDYHLLDMNGVDLIKALRASTLFAKTPIVMASGLDVEDEAIKAGANRFLIKPYDPDDLSKLFTQLTAVAPATPAATMPTTPAAAPTSKPAAPSAPTTTPASPSAPAPTSKPAAPSAPTTTPASPSTPAPKPTT